MPASAHSEIIAGFKRESCPQIIRTRQTARIRFKICTIWWIPLTLTCRITHPHWRKREGNAQIFGEKKLCGFQSLYPWILISLSNGYAGEIRRICCHVVLISRRQNVQSTRMMCLITWDAKIKSDGAMLTLFHCSFARICLIFDGME